MFVARETFGKENSAEFIRPVESIMRCEDFKSNFARRLSNRYSYSSKNSISLKQDTVLKLQSDHIQQDSAKAIENVEETTEALPQFSKKTNMEENGEALKPPDKPVNSNEHRRCSTEVSALNMEVETLRWQLAQTEANRQMHLALLRQIVSFLNRVKEHMEYQKVESKPKKEKPKSFNSADLPLRSRSVLHVNKNIEYSLTPSKKLNKKNLSKSITNVHGFKDSTLLWNQSKLSLAQETDSSLKITEEISRLITLANTVISTKIPDLACSCSGSAYDVSSLNSFIQNDVYVPNFNETFNKKENLDLIEEDTTNLFATKSLSHDSNVNEDKFSVTNTRDSPSAQSFITYNLENNFSIITVHEQDHPDLVSNNLNLQAKEKSNSQNSKKHDFNHGAFIEDESGFSSMSSFQEIGIPIINIIPPTPCRDIGYTEAELNIMDGDDKWKAGTLELDKQAMKVFWV